MFWKRKNEKNIPDEEVLQQLQKVTDTEKLLYNYTDKLKEFWDKNKKGNSNCLPILQTPMGLYTFKIAYRPFLRTIDGYCIDYTGNSLREGDSYSLFREYGITYFNSLKDISFGMFEKSLTYVIVPIIVAISLVKDEDSRELIVHESNSCNPKFPKGKSTNFIYTPSLKPVKDIELWNSYLENYKGNKPLTYDNFIFARKYGLKEAYNKQDKENRINRLMKCNYPKDWAEYIAASPDATELAVAAAATHKVLEDYEMLNHILKAREAELYKK